MCNRAGARIGDRAAERAGIAAQRMALERRGETVLSGRMRNGEVMTFIDCFLFCGHFRPASPRYDGRPHSKLGDAA